MRACVRACVWRPDVSVDIAPDEVRYTQAAVCHHCLSLLYIVCVCVCVCVGHVLVLVMFWSCIPFLFWS